MGTNANEKSSMNIVMKWGLRATLVLALAVAAHAQQTVADWQREAVRKYPELGQKGSALNGLFVSEYSRLSKEEPAFFSDPQWPMILARECEGQLKPGSAAESSPSPAIAVSQATPSTLGTAAAQGTPTAQTSPATNAGEIVSYVSDGPEKVSYHVYFPTSFDPTRPPAMIVMFSPGGNGKSILGSVKEACEALNWIGVGCDQFKNDADENELDAKWREALPHIEKTVPHDPDLLYLGGMSGGALRAYDYSESSARAWKGVLAFGGWLGGKKKLRCPAEMVVAMVNGDKDKASLSWEVTDGPVLHTAHCKVKEFHFPGGHEVAPAPVVLEAMQWMKNETKPGNRVSAGKRSPTPLDKDMSKAAG